jgi:hypothetical protein
MIFRHVTNLTEKRSRNCLPPVFSEDRYMTNDHREAETVYPRFSVRFVTWRTIIEKQELFMDKQFLILYDHLSCNEPHWKSWVNSSCFSMIIRHVSRNCLPYVFSEVRYMTDDHRETGTAYPWFSVRFVTWRTFIDKQELRHVTNLTENRG